MGPDIYVVKEKYRISYKSDRVGLSVFTPTRKVDDFPTFDMKLAANGIRYHVHSALCSKVSDSSFAGVVVHVVNMLYYVYLNINIETNACNIDSNWFSKVYHVYHVYGYCQLGHDGRHWE